MRDLGKAFLLVVTILLIAFLLMSIGISAIKHTSSSAFELGIILIGLALYFVWLVVRVIYTEVMRFFKGNG